MTDIKHWLAWKEKCALALCPPDTQAPLQSFVHSRYCRYTAKYASIFPAAEFDAPSLSPRETWHWFESYFQIHKNRLGKSYKDWLFTRSSAAKPAPDNSDIESGASLLLRDVVRDRLRHECSPRRTLSLDANTSSSTEDHPISFTELLPDEFDTSTEVERLEIANLSASLADSAFETLSHRERLALFAREHGLYLSAPKLLEIAACSRSTMAAAHQSALTTVANLITVTYPNEPRSTQASLTVAVFSLIRQKIISWSKSETALSEFLNTMK